MKKLSLALFVISSTAIISGCAVSTGEYSPGYSSYTVGYGNGDGYYGYGGYNGYRGYGGWASSYYSPGYGNNLWSRGYYGGGHSYYHSGYYGRGGHRR